LTVRPIGLQALFSDRAQAGSELSAALSEYSGREDVAVLALPRGGVPVGFEVARKLGAPLDVFVVRKLGLPGQPELAMGAIASGGVRVLNDEVVEAAEVPPERIEEAAAREHEELARRESVYRGERAALTVEGKTVILVDDGLATGSSMRAAVRALREQRPAQIVVAVPIAPPATCEKLAAEADDVVCAHTPEPFLAISAWYDDFPQVSDDEIRELLAKAGGDAAGETETSVVVHADGADLEGTLTVPAAPVGVVLFAHGSGSSRHSPRNQFVAAELRRASLATLLTDLLTAEEDELDRQTAELRFDIGLLAGRVGAATDSLAGHDATRGLPIGLFGASTGAAAALIAAAERPDLVRAVVSRGGRPDLAGEALAKVRAPTLLIVGGEDQEVLRLNQKAQTRLQAENELETVPDATHLFEEPGALERAAVLAREWFARHLEAR
jgi:putative phosphoribosyl transferase